MRNIVTFAILAAFAANASAAGFRLTGQGARAAGMGSAFTAVADDGSAMWYNPAGLSNLEGSQFSAGTVMETPSMQHLNADGTTDTIETKTHIPPHMYATRKINGKFAVGVAMNVPFGLSTQWDPNSSATREVATYSALKAINTNMSASYKVNEDLSVAAGASFVNLDAEMNKKIEFAAPAQNIEQKLKGSGNGVGYNVSALYKWNKWNFGANYHSKVAVDVKGKINLPTTGTFTNVVKPANNQDATTKITLPDILQLGVAFRPNADWLFTADADYTNWATYHKLVIDYMRDNGTMGQSVDYKKWSSAWAFRTGAEYKVNENWKARGGLFYDVNPVKEDYFETRVPDSDRIAWSVGGGYTKGDITVDASFTYLKFLPRTIDNSLQDNGPTQTNTSLNGKYYASATLPAVTVSYKF